MLAKPIVTCKITDFVVKLQALSFLLELCLIPFSMFADLTIPDAQESA